jgi:organic hydroperoxide reductase OsmC/OhrA
MLSYLHHAALNGVVVVNYVDHPTAVMTEDGQGGGKFTDITLHPVVTVTDEAMVEAAERLHSDANRSCFVASSLAVPVSHDVTTVVRAA